jgi:outer membrane protein assembly factor BamB
LKKEGDMRILGESHCANVSSKRFIHHLVPLILILVLLISTVHLGLSYEVEAADASFTQIWQSGDIGEVQDIVVDDVDGDGADEIVVATYNGLVGNIWHGYVYIFDASTHALEWQSSDIGSIREIIVADLDGDGGKEIIAAVRHSMSAVIGDRYGYVYVFDGVTHSQIWQSGNIGSPNGEWVVEDLDGDGSKEIVISGMHYYSCTRHGHVYVFDGASFTEEWKSPDIGIAYVITVADADDDGVKEIVFGNCPTDCASDPSEGGFYYPGYIYVYDGVNFNQEWQSGDIGAPYHGCLNVNDVDDDGEKEIIAGVIRTSSPNSDPSKGYIYVFNGRTFTQEWKSPRIYAPGRLRIEDSDQDGTKEILVSATEDFYVFDGKTHVDEWMGSQISGVIFNLEVVDIDNDGTNEILTRDVPQKYQGYLCVIDAVTHAEEWRSGDIGTGALTVADIDGDGWDEIIAGGSTEEYNGYLYIFGSTTPVGLADTPWPMFQHDLMHTGRSPYIGTATATHKWSYATESQVWMSSPAIGDDGTIYIGSDDHYVYALNPDGTLKWRYATGDRVFSSPAIGADGTIYVGSMDDYIYALNPDGTLNWRYATGGNVWSSPAIGADGTIYVGSYDNYVYALNPDGTLNWRYATGNYIESSPANGADGTIYIGSDDHYVYALNPNGTLKWRYATGVEVWSSPAIGADGTIYVGSADDYIYALNPNGTLKWRYATGDQIGSSPAIGADGTIYIGSMDYYIYALNPDGTLKWRYATGDRVYVSSPAIGADGTIYIGSNDHYVYALNPNGTLKWRYATEEKVWSSPAIGADGTIYIGSMDYYVYAIGEAPNTPIGIDVTVALPCAVVTFGNVTAEGDTTCTTQQGNPYPSMPEGFRVRGQFVNVETTATYDQPGVEVCIPYNPSEPNPENLKLFHWEGGHWVDVTTNYDPVNHYVCGYVTNLSWFFIGGEWVWIDDVTGVPVFPSVYIGIAAALGAGVLAFLYRKRILGRRTSET